MKKTRLLLTLLLVAGVATLGFGQITGSAHDFSSPAWNPTGEICIVCHTPHNGDVSVPDAPLWNHELTTQIFTLYTSSTLDATTGQPDGISKLCLSCHDGETNMDAFGGVAGSTTIGTGNPANTGIDLSDDHPISFQYTTTLATDDGELVDPVAANSSGLGGTIQDDMLFSDNLECASCHDVHNSTGLDYLLVKSNAGSALCLTCHAK